jgi:hypothetical protein
VFFKDKDPFYKKQKYTKGLHSLKNTRKILDKVNPNVSKLLTRKDFMLRSRETQRELDNESQYNHDQERSPERKKVPMAYLVREFQKSLNNGEVTESAVRNTEASSKT